MPFLHLHHALLCSVAAPPHPRSRPRPTDGTLTVGAVEGFLQGSKQGHVHNHPLSPVYSSVFTHEFPESGQSDGYDQVNQCNNYRRAHEGKGVWINPGTNRRKPPLHHSVSSRLNLFQWFQWKYLTYKRFSKPYFGSKLVSGKSV